MEWYCARDKDVELQHHGIDGMHWGVRNGPPYPLSEARARLDSAKSKYDKLMEERSYCINWDDGSESDNPKWPKWLQNKYDKVVEELNKLEEGEYSKAIFDVLNEEKPDLIRNRTGEVISWDDAWGGTYDNISKSLRHSLVALLEGGGRYRFKDKKYVKEYRKWAYKND